MVRNIYPNSSRVPWWELYHLAGNQLLSAASWIFSKNVEKGKKFLQATNAPFETLEAPGTRHVSFNLL